MLPEQISPTKRKPKIKPVYSKTNLSKERLPLIFTRRTHKISEADQSRSRPKKELRVYQAKLPEPCKRAHRIDTFRNFSPLSPPTPRCRYSFIPHKLLENQSKLSLAKPLKNKPEK
ncbi:unnamed protein product [Moneuplotes crassus]|uniref:Uncharacterized protein n=1 Tax=Euplotes crassus TaxID=5936 RepID=A0AAD1XVH0_EUPCR|nr:unnamed protein product [Moneuplotes crassus]